MNEVALMPPTEISPQLLYRRDEGHASFATWRLVEGHEALALFTTAAAAESYRSELAEPTNWCVLQPPRGQLIEILEASRAAGILYAALDPLAGAAKSLFDLPRVLGAAMNPTAA